MQERVASFKSLKSANCGDRTCLMHHSYRAELWCLIPPSYVPLALVADHARCGCQNSGIVALRNTKQSKQEADDSALPCSLPNQFRSIRLLRAKSDA